MTGITILGSRHMVVSLTQCIGTIVTGIAASIDYLGTGMINKSANKTFGVMTIATIRGCHWMILHLIFTRRIDIVVTGFACHGYGIQH